MEFAVFRVCSKHGMSNGQYREKEKGNALGWFTTKKMLITGYLAEISEAKRLLTDS
jgi:hypothetical protein